MLLSAFPSMWSISSGVFPVIALRSFHPHLAHWEPYLCVMYLMIWPDKFLATCPLSPFNIPCFHSRICAEYLWSLWHMFEQYFFAYCFVLAPHCMHIFIETYYHKRRCVKSYNETILLQGVFQLAFSVCELCYSISQMTKNQIMVKYIIIVEHDVRTILWAKSSRMYIMIVD